jgi:hypothetical protein
MGQMTGIKCEPSSKSKSPNDRRIEDVFNWDTILNESFWVKAFGIRKRFPVVEHSTGTLLCMEFALLLVRLTIHSP